MRLLVLAFFLTTCQAFTVIPYIQIDFAHFFRLAQCYAKCSEKYGTLGTPRTLNDGTVNEYLDVSSEDMKFCELGCQHLRRGKKVERNAKQSLHDGSRFWQESAANSSKVGNSPLATVRLLCQAPSTSDTQFEDSAEGRVGLTLRRNPGAVRYIVQWKQRAFTLGFYDETQWITASIESDTMFKVEGMIPGVQYRFMVTAVGPNGRLGDAVLSDWSETRAISEVPKAPASPLHTKNGYDSDRGVNTLVSWPRKPTDSCMYRITLSNATHITMRDFEVDASEGLLLSNLEFDSAYTAQVAALQMKTGEQTKLSPQLSTQFTSVSCVDVFGRGSLNCAPEPVDELKVTVHPNGTVRLSWKPSAPVDNVLTYRIEYQAVSGESSCNSNIVNIYLKAINNGTELLFDPSLHCIYAVRVTNFDLIGREATAERRVEMAERRAIFPFALDWQTLVIIASVAAILAFFCILRCSVSSRCKAKVNEKKNKLVDQLDQFA